MVTYIDESNAKEYRQLFNLAEVKIARVYEGQDEIKAYNGSKVTITGSSKMSSEQNASTITTEINKINGAENELSFSYTDVIDNEGNIEEAFFIFTLQDYFKFLPILKRILEIEQASRAAGALKTPEEVTSEDTKNRMDKLVNKSDQFIRLPKQENFFEIDGNTRTISIPANYNRNGIGVIGDTYAETLYFSIDRYYDHKDLADENLTIAIQYRIGGKDYLDHNATKEILVDANGREKLVFGWVIDADLTKVATSIQFIVRFYKFTGNVIEYSFSTVPAQVAIRSTLTIDNDALQAGNSRKQIEVHTYYRYPYAENDPYPFDIENNDNIYKYNDTDFQKVPNEEYYILNPETPTNEDNTSKTSKPEEEELQSDITNFRNDTVIYLYRQGTALKWVKNNKLSPTTGADDTSELRTSLLKRIAQPALYINEAIPEAGQPIFIINPIAVKKNEDNELVKLTEDDLNEVFDGNNTSLDLMAYAARTTKLSSGTTTYEWFRYPSDGEGGFDLSASAKKVDEEGSDDGMSEATKAKKQLPINDINNKYINNTYGTYYVSDNAENLNLYENLTVSNNQYASNGITINGTPYVQAATVKVSKTGAYGVEVTTGNGSSTRKRRTDMIDLVKIPGPTPIVAKPVDETNTTDEANGVKMVHILKGSEEQSRVLKVETDLLSGETATYAWYERDAAEEYGEPLPEEIEKELTVSYEGENFDKYYKVKIDKTRNGDSATPVDNIEFHISEKPAQFTFNGIDSQYKYCNFNENLQLDITKIVPPGKTDNKYYLWLIKPFNARQMPQYRENISSIEDFNSGLDDELNRVQEFDILDNNVAELNNGVVHLLNNNGDNKFVFDNENKKVPGIYYCILINKYNNFYSTTLYPEVFVVTEPTLESKPPEEENSNNGN